MIVLRKRSSDKGLTVNVTLVPSSANADGVGPNQYLITYLIDENLAIDAGCLGLFGSPHEQARVKHVVLSHTHADHLASLPIFVENAYEANGDCVTVYGNAEVVHSLRHDIFNGRIWPDFIELSGQMAPFLKLVEIESHRPFDVPGARITPIAVDHLVPTLGFLITSGASSVIVTSDTGPTEAIWDLARATPGLKAVFLEASFPDSMTPLANLSKHLTPATFAAEVRKLGRDDVDIIAVHMKPRYRDQILDELGALAIPNLTIGQFGQPYVF